MNPPDDIVIGQRFTRLVVTSAAFKKHEGEADWRYRCVCDCGKHAAPARWALLRKRTQSCGCLQKEFWKNWARASAMRQMSSDALEDEKIETVEYVRWMARTGHLEPCADLERDCDAHELESPALYDWEKPMPRPPRCEFCTGSCRHCRPTMPSVKYDKPKPQRRRPQPQASPPVDGFDPETRKQLDELFKSWGLP